MQSIVDLLSRSNDPEYLAEQRRIDIIRARIMAFYALFVYGGFWGVDLLAYPAHAVTFGLLRALVVILGVTVGILSYVRPSAGLPLAARFLGILAPSLIAWMCAQTEGFASTYMVGIIICFNAVTTLELYRPAPLAVVLGSVTVFYVAVNARAHPESPAHIIVSSTSFLCGSVVFCVMASALLEAQRRNIFRVTHALNARNRELDATVRALRETQTRLVETEKLSALGRLIASLSHEINNPVNVLRHNLQPLRGYLGTMTDVLAVARSRTDLEDAWAEHDLDFVLADALGAVETMEQGVERIQGVHREMRAFVRGDAPEMRAGDLNEGLSATVNMFRRSLPRDVPIEVQCGPLPPTLFQPGQMNQVFFNLIQNAVDAIEGAEKPGSIVVRTEVDGGSVRLTVEDTGPGVSVWAREHLFEPFFTTKPAGKGTGLGLAVSYQIVQRHGGRIELDDTYRAGARFVVRLPVNGQTVDGGGTGGQVRG